MAGAMDRRDRGKRQMCGWEYGLLAVRVECEVCEAGRRVELCFVHPMSGWIVLVGVG